MSQEQKYGEAVAELTRRLSELGLEAATRVAHDFMHDLVQAGWRPSAPPVDRGGLAEARPTRHPTSSPRVRRAGAARNGRPTASTPGGHMKPANVHATHRLGTCPACDGVIEAVVEIEPTFGEAKINGGRVDLPVTATMVGYIVEHSCHGKILVAEHGEVLGNSDIG